MGVKLGPSSIRPPPPSWSSSPPAGQRRPLLLPLLLPPGVVLGEGGIAAPIAFYLCLPCQLLPTAARPP